uniref:Integrase catalytic domain-containing protein n=1 Tax=Nicotiana tabacum TaxID=4097 RepID=A0A1S4DCG6_TOBAC|nr:PREDICTED: uncharacterized protein LOC107828156 [Nicotiana tabacum]
MAIDENTTDSINPLLDLTNPLFMHPSESVGSMLVLVPFDGSGYRSWRRGVLRALSVKNKVRFINGKCRKPDSKDPSYDQWEQCDNMVTSWILNSISKDLTDNLQYVNDAQKLWQELEDRYDQTNGAKLYQLQKEINDLSQGTLDITGCKCNCTCGAKANMQKVEQDRRLIQFLMELNEVYTVVRGNNAGYTNYNQQGNRTGNNNYRGGYFGSRPRFFCDYCKKPGHTKERCYKLHGYPQDSRFNKGKRIVGNVYGSQSENGIEGEYGGNGQVQEHDRTMQNLTKEQYNQLLSILENFHAGNGGNELKAGAVNFAGISACSTSFDSGANSYECFRSIADSWILDSGDPSLKRPLAIGKSKDGLYLYTSYSCKSNSLVNANSSSSSNKGDAITKSVSHVPSSLTSSNNVVSHSVSHVVPSSHTSSHECNKVVTNSHVQCKGNANSTYNASMFDKDMIDLLWHNRLGHVAFAKMRGIESIPVVKAFTAMVKNQFNCSIKTIRTDNGLEFINSKTASFLQSEGIIHQKICSYTPQQNGIVERKHKYLLETARALLVFLSFPQINSDLAQDLFPPHESVSLPSSLGPYLPAMSPDSLSLGLSESNSHTTSNFEEYSTLFENNQHETSINNTPNLVIQQPNETSGTPSRTLKVHTYLKDYNYSLPTLQTSHLNSPSSSNQSITSLSFNVSIPNAQCVSLNALSSASQQLIKNISHGTEPSSYEEAAADLVWQTTMNQEFEALYANHTWSLVPLPAGKRIIGCKWIYKVQYKADGSIERFKARLVVKGYTQQAEVDYTETFSSVVKMTTVRALIGITVKKG